MDDKVADIVGGGFDLAIRGSKLKESNLIARPLAQLNSVLCAAPEYIKQNGTPQILQELKQHNCLAFTYSRDVKEWSFELNGEKEQIEIHGNLQVNNSEALREAIVSGLGIWPLTYLCRWA